MCTFALNLTDIKLDETISNEKFEEAELLFKIRSMQMQLSDSEENLKNFERQT